MEAWHVRCIGKGLKGRSRKTRQSCPYDVRPQRALSGTGIGKDGQDESSRHIRGRQFERRGGATFRSSTLVPLVDPETMEFEAVENTQSTQLAQGAGIQAAENIAKHNPAAVLTGNCGPKAFRVLQSAGVGVVVGVKGKIEEAVRAYARGDYQPAGEANVQGHWM